MSHLTNGYTVTRRSFYVERDFRRRYARNRTGRPTGETLPTDSKIIVPAIGLPERGGTGRRHAAFYLWSAFVLHCPFTRAVRFHFSLEKYIVAYLETEKNEKCHILRALTDPTVTGDRPCVCVCIVHTPPYRYRPRTAAERVFFFISYFFLGYPAQLVYRSYQLSGFSVKNGFRLERYFFLFSIKL